MGLSFSSSSSMLLHTSMRNRAKTLLVFSYITVLYRTLMHHTFMLHDESVPFFALSSVLYATKLCFFLFFLFFYCYVIQLVGLFVADKIVCNLDFWNVEQLPRLHWLVIPL